MARTSSQRERTRRCVDFGRYVHHGSSRKTLRSRAILPGHRGQVRSKFHQKLSKFRTVKEALDEIKKETVVTVEPKIEKNEDGVFLTIPEKAGYGLIKEPIENLK